MKIRSDYVSNSSSSSFVLMGEKMDSAKFGVEDFDSLGEGEAFILVLKNRGSEGDYLLTLTPELLMDLDMHQLDLSHGGDVPIIRAKYYLTEGGCLYPASTFKNEREDYEYDPDKEDAREKFNKMCRTDGVALPNDCRMFTFHKDYGNPRDRATILDELESAFKYPMDD